MSDVSREQQIRERETKTTPGPWMRHSVDFREQRSHSVKCSSGAVISFQGFAPDGGTFYNNSEFIAHARQDIPYLLEENVRLREQLSSLGVAGDELVAENVRLRARMAEADAEANRVDELLILERAENRELRTAIACCRQLVETLRAEAASTDFVDFGGAVNVHEVFADALTAALDGEAVER